MRVSLAVGVALLSLVLVAVLLAAPQPQGVNWGEVLGPSQGSIPAPLSGPASSAAVKGGPKAEMVATDIHWRTDVNAALKEAQRTGRPVFVTMRCLPCKQCADFDKDILEGGTELTPLLRQFITVRLIDAASVDMRLLPMAGFQDLDLSWWGWFLSPDGRVYGIFGGKDHVSESTRISEAALVNTLQRVLAHHYDPRRASWDIDGPAPKLTGPAATPTKLPGYAKWQKGLFPGAKQECLHCHQVVEVMRQPLIDARKFDKQRDTQVWPLPENVGITLDRDHGLRVSKVDAGSPADRAGIKPGDVLGAAGGRRLFGQADFRGVLHRGPSGAGGVDVVWLRGSEVMSGRLELADGWRQTNLGWRMSISQGNIGASPGFFPLKGGSNSTMSVKPFWGPNAKTAPILAGLQKNHTIVAVNGQSPPVEGREFLVWFRMKFDPGDTVVLTVRDPSGQTKDIRYTAGLKDW